MGRTRPDLLLVKHTFKKEMGVCLCLGVGASSCRGGECITLGVILQGHPPRFLRQGLSHWDPELVHSASWLASKARSPPV